MLINRLIGGLIMKNEVRREKQVFKSKLVLMLFFCVIFSGISQNGYDEEVNKKLHFLYNHPNGAGIVLKDHVKSRSQSGDAYYLMNLRHSIGALNSLILTTEDEYWIEEHKQIINNLINSAEISANIPNNQSYHDNFKGWISKNPEKSGYQKEVPLYESYSFFYISQFLYILNDIGWVDRSNQNTLWWQNTLAFVENNIWTKWFVRSSNNNGIFLRSRTHMGSHWAGIAMYLGAISDNPLIKSQAENVVADYDMLLKRNLIEVEGGYQWNATYDDVSGTDASSTSSNSIQDVSHGNHVISYIVAAYEFGNENWTLSDLQKLAYTVKHFIYDHENKQFFDFVDGTYVSSGSSRGNFVGDGWVKLAAYDEQVKNIFTEFGLTNNVIRYSQEFQYRANMYKFKLANDSL